MGSDTDSSRTLVSSIEALSPVASSTSQLITMPLATQKQRPDNLNEEYAAKIRDITNSAKHYKATSDSRKRYQEYQDECKVLAHLRAQKITEPLFRWLRGYWGTLRIKADARTSAQLLRLNIKMTSYDRRVDVWAKEKRHKVVKEWSRETRGIIEAET